MKRNGDEPAHPVWRGRVDIASSRADLRSHGGADGYPWWRTVRYALLGNARCITADRNVLDVLVDECRPFGALAKIDLPLRKRCPSIIEVRECDPSLCFVAGIAELVIDNVRYECNG